MTSPPPEGDRAAGASPGALRSAAVVVAFLAVAAAALVALYVRIDQVRALADRTALPGAFAAVELVAFVGAIRGARRIGAGAWSDVTSASLARDALVGYPVFGALCWLVGLVRVSASILGVVVAGFAVLGAYAIARGGRPASGARAAVGPVAIAALGLLGIGLGISLLQAQLPAFSLDEVTYHLTVPKAWLLEGRVVSLPLNSQSFYPSGCEAADLPLLAVLGDRGVQASHLVHLAIAIATAVVVGDWLASKLDAEGSLVGLAAILLTPALLVQAGWSWNEWPLVGISATLLVVADAFARDAEPSRARTFDLGVALGAGVLCKYTSVGFAAIVLVALAPELVRARPRMRAAARALALGAGLAAVFPLRNLVLTGNPVEPFFSKFVPRQTGFRSLAQPLDYVFDPSFTDEALGGGVVALLFALPLGWSALANDRFLRRVGAGCAGVAIAIAASGASARVLLPFAVGAALAGLVGIDRAAARWTSAARAAVRGSLVAIAAAQLLLVAAYANWLRPYATLGKDPQDRAFLWTFLNGKSAYPKVEWIDGRLPEGSRTLVLGIHQLFHFRHVVRGAGNFDGARVAHYLDAPDPAALRERLRADRFTHVALYRPKLVPVEKASRGLTAEMETIMTPDLVARLDAMLQADAALVASENGIELYELR